MTEIATDTSRRSGRETWLVVGIVLVIFGSALLLITQRLRKELQVRITQQNGIPLGVALMLSSPNELPEKFANDPEILFAVTAERVLEVVKRKNDVFGARVFTRTGALELSIGVGAGDLAPEQLAQVKEGKTINWFEPGARLSESLGHDSDVKVPLIHTIVPLEQAGQFIGAAEFIRDGQEVMMVLRELDRDLWVYTGLILLMVVGSTAGVILWASRRLEGVNGPMQERRFERLWQSLQLWNMKSRSRTLRWKSIQ